MKVRNIVLFVIVLLFSACKKNKEINTRIVSVAPFDTVVINSSFNVNLVEDSVYYISIHGPVKTVENINYEVVNRELRLQNNTKNKWLKPTTNKVDITIHSLPLAKVTVNATCNIKTQTPITSDEFGIALKSKANEANLQLNCKKVGYWCDFLTGGKLTMSGNTDRLYMKNNALMSVDAKDLIIQDAYVQNSSHGNLELKVINALTYTVSGPGDIVLYPPYPSQINAIEISSTGRLLKQ